MVTALFWMVGCNPFAVSERAVEPPPPPEAIPKSVPDGVAYQIELAPGSDETERASDLDRDGVDDVQDRCPTIPEDPDGEDDGDGCPEGKDATLELCSIDDNPAVLRGPDGEPVQRRDGALSVRVWYGTDRAFERGRFGPSPNPDADPLSFGSVDVSIPPDHKTGHLERPLLDTVWEREGDPSQHITVLTVERTSRDRFVLDVSRRVAASDRKEALVWIHGFANSFEDAARDTARIAFDLCYEGAPLFFSWPSRDSVASYGADRSQARLSTFPLRTFLELVMSETGAERVHLIGHSLGTQPLLEALYTMHLKGQSPDRVDQLVLHASDADLDYFQKVITEAPEAFRAVTVYGSQTDNALWASSLLRQVAKLGQVDARWSSTSGKVAFVDVTEVDDTLLGHTYYGGNLELLADFREVVRRGTPPPRAGLTRHPDHPNVWQVQRK